MNSHQRTRFEMEAQVAKALAHPTRLMMLDALSRDDRCVGELAERVKAEPSTVSRHLVLLKNLGIVTDRKEGNKIYYHLEIPCILSFFQCALEVLNERSRVFRARARKRPVTLPERASSSRKERA